MLALALLLLAQSGNRTGGFSPENPPPSELTRTLRAERVLRAGARTGPALAFFEAFPQSGAGTTGVCSTVAPTGAKGEALTFTRGSNGTCTKTAAGGLSTTSIADGDLVVLSSNVARQMYDSNGVLGLLVEASRTNSNLQSANLADAAYTSIGAPTVTANTTVSPDGTTTMATIQDNSGAAQEGRQQVIVATSGQPYTLSVYVKAGTLSSVTVSLDGTTATCTSLSATTSTRCIVTDASASGVAINAQVLGGTVVGDTGTFRAWGQQVELGSYATSYIPTTSATVTRSADLAAFSGFSLSTSAGVSWAASVQSPTGNGGGVWGSGANIVADALNRSQLYRANTNVQNCDYFSTSGNRSAGPVIAAYVAGQVYRQACSYSGAGASSTISGYRDGVLTATSATGLTSAFIITSVLPGALGDTSSVAPADSIVSRICVDPDPTRCR
jgi:hypothetical protein